MADWREYQEDAAQFFRSLGLVADTDVRVRGTRTMHDVDVLVKSSQYGFDVTWIVECKHWKEAVSKLHVLALRQIVIDAGADRGIILCEAGFQSGALEAANLTNVKVTSLAELQITASEQISAVRLGSLYERVELYSARYWEFSKSQRIEDGLRSYVGEAGYSGAHALELCRELLSSASLSRYPIEPPNGDNPFRPIVRNKLYSASDVVSTVEEILNELEAKLIAAETKRSDRLT